MQRPFLLFANTLPSLAVLLLLAAPAAAQRKPERAPVPGETFLSLGFAAATANDTAPTRFWLTGGNTELTATLPRGFALTASLIGLHTANAGGGTPVNLVVATFGPTYRRPATRAARSPILFVHALAGQANGFGGLYPSPYGPIASSDSLAVDAGGGLDLQLRGRLAIRAVEVSWLHTQLPDAARNVQNNLYLATGLVLRLH